MIMIIKMLILIKIIEYQQNIVIVIIEWIIIIKEVHIIIKEVHIIIKEVHIRIIVIVMHTIEIIMIILTVDNDIINKEITKDHKTKEHQLCIVKTNITNKTIVIYKKIPE